MKNFILCIALISLIGCDLSEMKSLSVASQEAYDYYTPLLPRQSDPDTKLNSIEIQKQGITLNSTLFTVAKSEIDLEYFNKTLPPILLKEAKNTPKLRAVLEAGGIITYNYTDKDGDFVSTITLD